MQQVDPTVNGRKVDVEGACEPLRVSARPLSRRARSQARGAMGDIDAGALADVCVIGAFISVLEPAPAADIIEQDHVEVGRARFHIRDQLLQRRAPANGKTALAGIGIGLDDLDAAPLGIFADLVGLVVGRMLLGSVEMRTYCTARNTEI